MTVLMGPSGCGKTTLLRIVAGLDDRYTGRSAFRGHPIGLMFQEPRLLPWRTVRQNIELVAPGFSSRISTSSRAVGIADMLPRYPQELSLGLARRVALARAFATKPDLLLLDEPFVSLDERTADRLRRLLLECGRRGRPRRSSSPIMPARRSCSPTSWCCSRRGRPMWWRMCHRRAASRTRPRRGRKDPHRSARRFPANFSGG